MSCASKVGADSKSTNVNSYIPVMQAIDGNTNVLQDFSSQGAGRASEMLVAYMGPSCSCHCVMLLSIMGL